ncbi:hypothetical protein D3C76_1680690 [compost metagenome]
MATDDLLKMWRQDIHDLVNQKTSHKAGKKMQRQQQQDPPHHKDETDYPGLFDIHYLHCYSLVPEGIEFLSTCLVLYFIYHVHQNTTS